MAGWFKASGEVTADPLSEGQCREDPVATRSLDYAIHCRLSGWDDYVSCADPEAAPDRCDPDDKISRGIRRPLAFPQQKDGGRMASAGRNEPARAAWLGSLSRRGCDPAGSWRRLKSAPVPPAASAIRPNLAPISRPIMMPSVASAKV